MSARDVSRDFFYLRWESPLMNLVCFLLDWSYYMEAALDKNI